MSEIICAICSDSLIGATDQYLEESPPVVFPCGHTFHRSCTIKYHEYRFFNPPQDITSFTEIYNCPNCKLSPVCTFDHPDNPKKPKYTPLFLEVDHPPHGCDSPVLLPSARARTLLAVSKRIAKYSALADKVAEYVELNYDGKLLDSEEAFDSYLKAGKAALEHLEDSMVEQQLKTDIDALRESLDKCLLRYDLINRISDLSLQLDLQRAQANARVSQAKQELQGKLDTAQEKLDAFEKSFRDLQEEERRKILQTKYESNLVTKELEAKFEDMRLERDKLKVSMKQTKEENDGMKNAIRDITDKKEKAEISAQAANKKLREQTQALLDARSQAEDAKQRRTKQAEKYLAAANKDRQEIETLRRQVASLKEENASFRNSLPIRSDRQSGTPSLPGHSRPRERHATSNLLTRNTEDAYDSFDESGRMDDLEESILEVEMPSLHDSFFAAPGGPAKPHPTRREIRIPASKRRSPSNATDASLKTSFSDPFSSPITVKRDIARPTSSSQAASLKPMRFSIGASHPLPGNPKSLTARSGIRNNPFTSIETKKIGKEGDYADSHGRIKKGVVSGPTRRFKATR